MSERSHTCDHPSAHNTYNVMTCLWKCAPRANYCLGPLFNDDFVYTTCSLIVLGGASAYGKFTLKTNYKYILTGR